MAQPPFRKSGFRSAPTFDGPPQGKRFSGLKCPEKFSNRTSLKQPVVKHRPAGPGGRTFTGEGHSFTGFDCDGCEKRFSDKKTLEAHRKHDHISCCDKVFKSEDRLKEHFRGSPRHPKCHECGLGFQNQQSLDAHDNEPAKVCCSERFCNQKHYRVHVRSFHPDWKACESGCDNSKFQNYFENQAELSRHINDVHLKQQGLECSTSLDLSNRNDARNVGSNSRASSVDVEVEETPSATPTELSINQDDIQDVTEGSRSSWIVSQVEETLPTPTLVAHTPPQFEEDQGSLELDRIYELIRHSSEWYPGIEMASNGPSDPDTLAVITPPRGSPSIQDRMASQLIERPRMTKYDPWLDEEPLELQVHVKRPTPLEWTKDNVILQHATAEKLVDSLVNDIDYDDHVLVDRALVHGPRLSEAPSRNCLAAHVDGFISFRPATNSTANVNLAQALHSQTRPPRSVGQINLISTLNSTRGFPSPSNNLSRSISQPSLPPSRNPVQQGRFVQSRVANYHRYPASPVVRTWPGAHINRLYTGSRKPGPPQSLQFNNAQTIQGYRL